MIYSTQMVLPVMPRFVAFLRGINVGGHVAKKGQLQEAFVSSGFCNVETFKQSGNVIFETSDSNADKIAAVIEMRLRSLLGFEVLVFVRTLPQLKTIVDFNPFRGQAEKGSSFLVTMLAKPPQEAFASQLPLIIPKSTAKIILAKGTEVFSVTHGGGEGALPNPFIESKLKVKATTRNLNVIREIVEKYGKTAI